MEGLGELPKEVLIIVGVIPVTAITAIAALDAGPGRLRAACALPRRPGSAGESGRAVIQAAQIFSL
jgi:hypothetical protein